MRTLQAGSKDDFDALYRETYPRVFRTLANVLGSVTAAEDCAQDAYLKAFRAWRGWKGEAPAEAWIFRIAINTAVSHRRRERLREVGELVRRLGRPAEVSSEEVAVTSDLQRELRRLPPKQAGVLVLRHLHGYSNREIAAALGESESTVASRLMAAKRALQARLDAGRKDSLDTCAGTRVPITK